MRAVTVNQFGELPKVADVTTPSEGPGQVLIKLVAASVNPMDAKLASGAWRPAPVTFPMILGVDGSGIVEAIGEGTTRFFPGDKVFGQLFISPVGAFGTYAEYVAVTADAPLACVPKGLDLIEAASAPTAGGTGLSLIELIEPLDNQVVLIIGAGGGVGTCDPICGQRRGVRVRQRQRRSRRQNALVWRDQNDRSLRRVRSRSNSHGTPRWGRRFRSTW